MFHLLLNSNFNIINVIIPVLAALIVVAVIVMAIINKKKGKTGCGCGCDCSKCSGCDIQNKKDIK